MDMASVEASEMREEETWARVLMGRRWRGRTGEKSSSGATTNNPIGSTGTSCSHVSISSGPFKKIPNP
jgi:hypothetical protein